MEGPFWWVTCLSSGGSSFQLLFWKWVKAWSVSPLRMAHVWLLPSENRTAALEWSDLDHMMTQNELPQTMIGLWPQTSGCFNTRSPSCLETSFSSPFGRQKAIESILTYWFLQLPYINFNDEKISESFKIRTSTTWGRTSE